MVPMRDGTQAIRTQWYCSGMESRRHRRNFNEPGHARELTFSCYRRFPFFKAERTCQWLADSLIAARESLEFDLWAFAFVPDHVHVIVRPRRSDCSSPGYK